MTAPQENTAACRTCNRNIREEEELYLRCDGVCKTKYHKECTGLTQGEFDILQRKNRKLCWLCDECRGLISEKGEPEKQATGKENEKIEDIKGKVEHIMDFLTNKLSNLIEEKITDSITRNAKNNAKPTEKIESHHQESSDEEQGEEENPTWAQVTRNRKRKNQESRTAVIIGRKEKENNSGQEENGLQAADKMTWLYAGKLKPSTTTETVTKFLTKNGIQGQTECEELTTRGQNKAFKVGIPFHSLDGATKADFWPKGVLVRRFRFRNTQRRNEGASLD